MTDRNQTVVTNILGGVFIPIFRYDEMDPRLRSGEIVQEIVGYMLCLRRPDGRELEITFDASAPVEYLITAADGSTESESPGDDGTVPLGEAVKQWEPSPYPP